MKYFKRGTETEEGIMCLNVYYVQFIYSEQCFNLHIYCICIFLLAKYILNRLSLGTYLVADPNVHRLLLSCTDSHLDYIIH